jgi:hypothetical protein
MYFRVALESSAVDGQGDPPLEVQVQANSISEAADIAEELYPGFEAYDIEEEE